jgi:hypothetical protein
MLQGLVPVAVRSREASAPRVHPPWCSWSVEQQQQCADCFDRLRGPAVERCAVHERQLCCRRPAGWLWSRCAQDATEPCLRWQLSRGLLTWPAAGAAGAKVGDPRVWAGRLLALVLLWAWADGLPMDAFSADSWQGSLVVWCGGAVCRAHGWCGRSELLGGLFLLSCWVGWSLACGHGICGQGVYHNLGFR